MINRLTTRYYSFIEKALINLFYKLRYYDNGILDMASTQNAPLWRSNLDLFWECHKESLVFYINMIWHEESKLEFVKCRSTCCRGLQFIRKRHLDLILIFENAPYKIIYFYNSIFDGNKPTSDYMPK